VAQSAALVSIAEAALTAGASALGRKRSLVAAMFRVIAGIEQLRPDRMTTARSRSPAASHHPNKS
jgi:hypothetical protein